MKSTATILAGTSLALVALWAAAEEPKSTTLTEKVEKRLVQLDVAVEGDRDAIRALTAKDFALYVGEHPVQPLILDPLCEDEPAPEARPASSATAPPESADPTARPRATFVFFFDQTHLTVAGRASSLTTSRDLVNRLIVGGSRASIVSNAKRLETIVPMTTDRTKLLAGLDRLRDDPNHWETYSETETRRVQDAFRTMGAGAIAAPGPPRPTSEPPRPACFRARTYAREEWQLTRLAAERIEIAVGALADVGAPKALVYFADTLRQKAGLHYLGACPLALSDTNIPSAAVEIDAAINAATARGVHFYTIQAEGLLAYRGSWDTMRHQHAQDTLVGLAAETGGEAFLGGASAKSIADRIEKLTSCRLLLSFPPGELPRDKAMNVTLAVNVPNVKFHTQGRVVVPSAASIEAARLWAALNDSESTGDGSLRAFVIPRGGDGKQWKGSVQLRLRPTGLPDNSAELGASIVRRDKVTDHFASSIATKSGSRAMVLEQSLNLPPGELSVVAVARDSKRGDVGSSRIECAWPNPEGSVAVIAPIAVLQTGVAAISTEGAVSSSGLLARDDDEALDPAASITLASVVCRGSKATSPVIVQRWLEGGSRATFTSLTIAETGDACVKIMDVVPEGHLEPGDVDYRIVARIGDKIVAQERRSLRIGTQP